VDPNATTLYGRIIYGPGFCSDFNVSDHEGSTGLNFVSAQDPRLVFDTTLTTTCDSQPGSITEPVHYPVKFAGTPNSGLVPLATGAEARLIEAEAALASGSIDVWTANLNTLRAAAPSTYLQLTSGVPALTPDSTTTASATERADVMFRERAFWLFGTGTRLGDLRRLIRQYGRDQSIVFPVGPYAPTHQSQLPTPIPNYGTDVTLTLPTAAGLAYRGQAITNPNYKGCIASTKTA
jgi:hypothetical protein